MRRTHLPALFALVFTLTLFAACSPDRPSQGRGASSDGEKSAGPPETTAGNVEDTVAEARSKSDDPVKEKTGGKSGETKKNDDGGSQVTLKFAGDPGARFSGACTVGGEKHKVEAQAPARITFDTDGRKLECELSKRADGLLEVTLVSGNNRYEQRTDAPRSTLSLSYSGSGFSSVVRTANATSSSITSTSRNSVNSSKSSVGSYK